MANRFQPTEKLGFVRDTHTNTIMGAISIFNMLNTLHTALEDRRASENDAIREVFELRTLLAEKEQVIAEQHILLDRGKRGWDILR